MSLSHQDAKATLAQGMPQLSAAESLYLRAVGFLESYYGTQGSWTGTNNWGALTGSGDAGSISHNDQRPGPDGPVSYTTKFRRYSTPLRGAAGLAGTLLKPVTAAAIKRGIIMEAAAAQYAYGYYTGLSTSKTANILSYARGLERTIRTICDATGEANPFVIGVDPLSAWRTVTRRPGDSETSIVPGLFRADKKAELVALGGAALPMSSPVVAQTTSRVFALVETTGKGHPSSAYSTTSYGDRGWAGWSKNDTSPNSRHYSLIEVTDKALPPATFVTITYHNGTWSPWRTLS
jgi:hypothetical protein